eukprot:TRINITY_DN24234_c0_g1_i1.p2 TRINITY_DN24234_c0_g1~~TRINITY_DN24234_c0_g1_i1.p2  ORF type:complete len:268 (+),score=79.57 TRINITY_DN24234_c0_g1_i1:59-805(+)
MALRRCAAAALRRAAAAAAAGPPGPARQQCRQFVADVAAPRQRRRREKGEWRYGDETPIAVVLQREGSRLDWDQSELQKALRALEVAAQLRHRYDETPGRVGSNPLPPGSVLTVEYFRDHMSPTQRLDLELPFVILVRLLELFVPEKFWKMERTPDELNKRRLEEWNQYKPQHPLGRKHMDDWRDELPAADYAKVVDLAENPPRGAGHERRTAEVFARVTEDQEHLAAGWTPNKLAGMGSAALRKRRP